MGVTAENLAERGSISRERQDAFAVESHRRAAAGARRRVGSTSRSCRCRSSVKRDTVEFARDEHIREDASPESMAKLAPAFKQDGTVTAGNASGMNDAGAAVVLMSAERAAALGAPVRARMLAYARCGVDPAIMGIGPVPAVRKRARARRPVARRGRGDRAQRGVRGAGAGGDRRPRARLGEGQPERRRDRARSPDRRDRGPRSPPRSWTRWSGATPALGLVTLCIGGGQGIALLLGRE